jgi:predicted DNA-binding transcriptional regulator YafY
MQINRLFEIVYILLEQKNVSAKELAERFEVSTRTIYRDIDTLSGAGIPIYASRGAGGGIRLMDDFVLNKSLLSAGEQNEILASLQGLNAIHAPDVEPVLTKLAALFGQKRTSWIDVDFSNWGGGVQERDKFILLKAAILHSNVITFEYYSAGGDKTCRAVEPLKLLFKGQGWYLYGFCRERQDWRVFKVTRMKNLQSTQEIFEREIPETVFSESGQSYKPKMIELKLKIDQSMAYRVYDEFEEDNIVKNEDGSFNVSMTFPEGDWVYGIILSFGAAAEVLEPDCIRKSIIDRLKDTLKKYK